MTITRTEREDPGSAAAAPVADASRLTPLWANSTPGSQNDENLRARLWLRFGLTLEEFYQRTSHGWW
jgi:hypothetical protein